LADVFTLPFPRTRHVEHIPFEFEEANGDYSAIANLGKFDVIILKEILYLAVDHLAAFINSLKLVGVELHTIMTNQNMKPTSLCFILTRPKDPPLPLPASALEMWHTMMPTRKEIIETTVAVSMTHSFCRHAMWLQAGYQLECFSVSCPIQIPPKEWGAILRTRCLPAISQVG
jgi:hypothetical protein